MTEKKGIGEPDGYKRLSNQEMRFNHRFQAFHNLEYPIALFYNHFQQATNLSNRSLLVCFFFVQFPPIRRLGGRRDSRPSKDKDLFSFATDRYKEAEGFLAKILTFAKADQSIKDIIPNIKRVCHLLDLFLICVSHD